MNLRRATLAVALVVLFAGSTVLEAQRGTGTGTGGGGGRGTGGGRGGGAGRVGGGGQGRGGQRGPQPVFRAGVELVEIDVVVVGKDGQPVHGLTRDDFVVHDRREPQAIETFEEIRRAEERAAELPPLPAATRVDVASNTASRSQRLVVMVLDDLHGYRGRDDTVKDIARTVVEDLGPESSMALIQTGGDHGVEVTQDRSRLLAAIDHYHGRRAVRRPQLACDGRGCDQQEFDADMSLYDALKNAARLLGGHDGRRRAFVLVSENLAKDLSGLFGMREAPDRSPRDSSAYVASGGDGEALAAIPVPPASYHDYGLLDMMDAMRRGGVATYAIDPRGEISSKDLMRECQPAFGFGDDPCLGEGQGQIPDWNAWVRQAQHGLEIMSMASGGFAVVNTNDFTSGIDRIASDLDNYYLIGFRNTDTKTTGYRPIDVSVRNRPDLTLRYRRGYQISGEKDQKRNSDPLVALIDSALPEGGLPMRLHAVPMPHGKEAHVAVAVELTVPRVAIASETTRLLDEIRYGFYAIDLKGAKVRQKVGQGARVQLSPRAGLAEVPDEVTYEITTVLPLAPGQYQIRASAESERLDKGGSVYLSLEVPDFSKMAFGLTDLVLGYADGPHVPIARASIDVRQPRGAGRGLVQTPIEPEIVLPFDPTLDRVFATRDTLRLYAQLVSVGGQAPVTATVSALAPDGTVKLTTSQALPAASPSALDIRLPLAQLGPGAYRLKVSVTDGSRTADREVGFAIR